MNKEVQKYINTLKAEEVQVMGDIARMERSLSRVRQKLSDPEKSFNLELKRGSVRVKRIFGEEVPKKVSNLKKANAEVKDLSPILVDHVPAAAVPVVDAAIEREIKRSGSTLFG